MGITMCATLPVLTGVRLVYDVLHVLNCFLSKSYSDSAEMARGQTYCDGRCSEMAFLTSSSDHNRRFGSPCNRVELFFVMVVPTLWGFNSEPIIFSVMTDFNTVSFTKSLSIAVICAVTFCFPHGRDFFRRRE